MTGATDGIGKAMILEMAKKGLNVVLISRSHEKLTACQEEIKAKYPKIDVRVLPIDYSKFDIMSRKKVEAFIADLDVGVLVNNVGVSYPFTKYFHELNDEEVENLMKLNVDSTTWMTRIVLPGMVSRNRGAIVNIGSGKLKLQYTKCLLLTKRFAFHSCWCFNFSTTSSIQCCKELRCHAIESYEC